ncbi:hypothetical protein MSG28_000419 [Choristoneura fumiferana]|uniref:Uncharacterized protein n=1 Tax=Choristoneura fumiferana TaxID=7141 RepID=A0ACC0K0R1_CHOFU|nr:hypothetical protein MSG28_000419 [Choristoneura fumiferana]
MARRVRGARVGSLRGGSPKKKNYDFPQTFEKNHFNWNGSACRRWGSLAHAEGGGTPAQPAASAAAPRAQAVPRPRPPWHIYDIVGQAARAQLARLQVQLDCFYTDGYLRTLSEPAELEACYDIDTYQRP